ncbi:hypothetical protein KKB64_02470 [Patescibacteria group bacterium]|nr:hypothetical protein [Patescibacteria group bacterium]MBU2460145.1 hypothetical protein [Patescibacteria group bacterium]MBU2544430.1 hypothetical protein [Patescibacteria group bacterium]
MKSFAIAVIVILGLWFVPHVSATSEKAYQDYLYQSDRYRQAITEFQTAKAEYEQYKSLSSQTAALAKTITLLTQRNGMLRTYLLLLNEKLDEDTGLASHDKQSYQALLQSEIGFLEKNTASITAVGSLEEAKDVSRNLESHYDMFSASVRRTIIGISLGRLNALARRYDELTPAIQSLITTYRNQYSPEKQATFDRWLVAITNKRSLFQQKADEITRNTTEMTGDHYDIDRMFSQMLNSLGEARQFLADGASYLRELIVALQYRD